MPNGSLDRLKNVKVEEAHVAAIMAQVLQGLKYLHANNIVHRDVKGANILVNESGTIKLADFGVATILTESQKTQTFTGTSFWMAPEVINTDGKVSSACDIWSMGITVIEMLEGKPPHFDKMPYHAMPKIVEEEVPSMKAIQMSSRTF